MASGYSDLSGIARSGQFYGLHQKPAKINLLDERPRRESVDEQQLAERIERPMFSQQQQQVEEFDQRIIQGNNIYQVQGSQETTSAPEQNQDFSKQHTNWATAASTSTPSGSTRMATRTSSNRHLRAYSELVNDLAEKEAKLRCELAYVNQHLANPWARPPKVREPRREPEARASSSQQRWVKEIPPSSTSSRPNSRASSTRSTTESDLMEKAERLLKDVEELERKPIKTQQILIESGARVRQHDAGTSSTSTSGSIRTAIIKVPAIEPDNKSPLPFAYDNFSTLGVRGNIASVGAAEPDTPYPPIFPIVKRTPSPRR